MRAPTLSLLVFSAVSGSSNLFAATTNCGTGSPGNAVTFNTANARSANGCEDVDTFFKNLNLSAHSGPDGPASNDQLFILGSFNSTVNPTQITATFSPAAVSGEQWTYTAGNDTGTIVTQFNWTVAIDPAFLSPSNLGYRITGITAGLTGESGTTSTRTISVTNAVCLNTASVCSSNPDYTLTLTNDGSHPANVIQTIPQVTMLSIQSTITLVKPANGQSPNLGSFFVEFDGSGDAPEPGTWSLMGAAFVGLGCWSYRRGRAVN